MPAIEHAVLLERLMEPLLEAGQCLLRHREAGVEREVKRDGSPVSLADRDAETIILAALGRAAPEIPVIAEEAVAEGRVPRLGPERRAFLVDALDGTKEFLKGGDDFTVNIGAVESGRPVFGMVLVPATGRVFATAGPCSAVAGEVAPADLGRPGLKPALRPIATAEPDFQALRILASRSTRSVETEAFLKRFRVGSDQRMGSSVKFCLIAAGEADLYPRFGPTSAWDIAAGHAVLAAAGGVVTSGEGAPIDYLGPAHLNAPQPFLNGPFIAWGRPELLAAAGFST